MKSNPIFLRMVAMAVMLGLASCDLFNGGDTPDPEPVDDHLVSYENVNSATVQMIKPAFQALEGQYSELAGISSEVKYGVWVYKVRYTTTYEGKDVEASGLVAVPMGSGAFPLLSFQNGTNTLHAKAPTANIDDNLFRVLQLVASTGFVVTLPDYLGFGAASGMYHPYLHKESTILSVTDLHRATRELLIKLGKNSLAKETYLMGYSQGGWATMALKQAMETTLSGEYTLKASSCGAGPYNLTAICSHILGLPTYPMPYFLAYMINSYIRSGEVTLTYADIFNQPYTGEGYISSLFDGTHDGDYINSKLSTSVPTLFKKEFLEQWATGEKYASLRTALDRNSVKPWKTTTATLIIHGIADTFVPATSSEAVYQGFRDAGVAQALVTFDLLPALGHQEAILPWGTRSLKWIIDQKGD
ncbi:MAG: alpha/beta fold hydrolase [Prolixibacteraceae bacterium]|jgi:pimeloyl-ACP methyl ester carboxylesterase|nr:alpha/beta fold hydrolase [Prolixibacteraceae bacterium]HPJ78019.1 alpha/beta fold hydrolase [Prolixibacteraceae bacterium]HRV88124.1 alpha/beta fold hydrolase [Prolixibacteraceae bacterium]